MPASYPPVLGGLQTVSHTLARYLLRRGHDVQVVTDRYPRTLAQREERDGVPVQRELLLAPGAGHLRRGRPDLALASLYFYPLALVRLRKLVRRLRPQVVNVHFPHAQVPFVLWLRRRYRFRLVVSLHGDEVDRWREDGGNEPTHFFESWRQLLEAADAVTACSRYLLRQASELVPAIEDKGAVIHNGIDAARFRSQAAYRHRRPYFLAYGRFAAKKGFDLLLQAWACAAPEYPQMELLLAGSGTEELALRRQAQALGIREQVCFFGQASAAQVVQLLNGCHFAVVPSRQEPFGIVALEALAAGRPLLATRVGGLPEFVANGNGNPTSRLVAPTVAELADGLRLMLEQGAVPAVAYEERRVLQSHGWDVVLRHYEQVICGR